MVFNGLIILSLCAAAVFSLPLDFAESEVDLTDVYMDDPTFSERERRSPQLSGQGSEHGGYVRADGSKTLFDNGKTRVDGHAGYQYTYGGGPKHQADVGASASHNLWTSKDRSATLDANANFNRHIGAGRPRDSYGGGLNFNKRF